MLRINDALVAFITNLAKFILALVLLSRAVGMLSLAEGHVWIESQLLSVSSWAADERCPTVMLTSWRMQKIRLVPRYAYLTNIVEQVRQRLVHHLICVSLPSWQVFSS